MKILILDKGHIGKNPSEDCGAFGNGLYESDLTDIIVEGIKKRILNKYDVDIKIAPRGTLNDRTNFANSINADYFLSVHINSAVNEKATGFESFIHNNASQKSLDIQNILHKEIMEYMKQYNVFDRGKKRANFFVLRNSKCSACLIECLFINSPKDAELLKNNKFLDGLSNSITFGLVQALNLKLKENASDITENINTNILQTKNAKNIVINGVKVEVDNYTINETTYLNAKDVAKIFNKKINWDAETKTVSIN